MDRYKAIQYYNESQQQEWTSSQQPLTLESACSEWVHALIHCQNNPLRRSFMGLTFLLSDNKQHEVYHTLLTTLYELFGITPQDLYVRKNLLDLKPQTLPWSIGTARALVGLKDFYHDLIQWNDINNKEAILFFAEHTPYQLARFHEKGTLDMTPYIEECLQFAHADIASLKNPERHPFFDMVKAPLPLKTIKLFDNYFISNPYFNVSTDSVVNYMDVDMDDAQKYSELKLYLFHKYDEHREYFTIMFNQELHWLCDENIRSTTQRIMSTSMLIEYFHNNIIDEHILRWVLRDAPTALTIQWFHRYPDYQYICREYNPSHDMLAEYTPDIPYRHFVRKMNQTTNNEEYTLL